MEAERENVDAREAATYACADARRRWREIEGRWTRGRSGGCEGAMEGGREKAGAREAAMCVCVCVCVRVRRSNVGRATECECEGGIVLCVCMCHGVIDGEGETVGAREEETYACADAR